MHTSHQNGIAIALAFAGAVVLGSVGSGGCADGTDGAGGASSESSGSRGGSSTGSPTSSGSGESSSSGQSSSSGSTPECVVAADCPTPNECSTPTCESGTCGLKFVPAQTVVGNEPLNDCKQAICDGAGNKSFIANDGDLPDDGNECTTDSCNAGVPSHTPKPMNSFCGPNGTYFCHTSTECKPCQELTAACEEIGPGEPTNDMQLTAHSFGSISDADSAGKAPCAVLKGGADVDWYTYAGVDNAFSVVDPYRKVSSDLKTRLCVYLQCTAGTATFTCPAGSMDDTAPLGQKGCCSEGPMQLSFDCAGVNDDDASVWLKVENPDALACVPYQLSFHY